MQKTHNSIPNTLELSCIKSSKPSAHQAFVISFYRKLQLAANQGSSCVDEINIELQYTSGQFLWKCYCSYNNMHLKSMSLQLPRDQRVNMAAFLLASGNLCDLIQSWF